MSQENVETVRRVVEAFNSRGIEAALPHVHPDLIWHAPPEWLEKRVYRGRDGLRELVASWGRNFGEYRIELQRLTDLDDGRVLALVLQRGRIKGSDNAIEHAVAWIVELVDGQMVRVDVYFSWEAGLEAAGLGE